MIGGRYDEVTTKASAIVARMGHKPFSNEIEDLAKAEVAAALGATKRVRERNPDGDLIYVDIPDRVLRAAVGIKILEHNIGKPMQRSVTATLTASADNNDPQNSQAALLDLLLAAPEAAADIIGKLQKAAQKAKASGIIDVTPQKPLPESQPSTS